MRTNILILVGLLSLVSYQVQGQTCFASGPTSVCPNQQASYFVSGCSCTYTIASVVGNPSRSGSTITWNVVPGNYDILFTAPGCSNITRTVTVQPTALSAGTLAGYSLCQGASASPLTATGVVGPVVTWRRMRSNESVWTDLSYAANPLPASFVDNTITAQYQIVVQNNCTAEFTATATVTINPLPAAPPVPTAGNVTTYACLMTPLGFSTSYSADATMKHNYYNSLGGLLTNGQVTPTNPTGTVYTSTFPTPAFGGSSTTFQYEAEVFNGCGSTKSPRQTITYTIQPNPSAPPIQFLKNSSPISSLNICSGEAISISANSGYNSYAWYTSAGGASIGATASLSSYSPPAGTTYLRLDAMWPNPCGGNILVTANLPITISNPSVQITGSPTTFCSASPTTFTASPSSGASNIIYQWSLTGGASGTAATFTPPNNLSGGAYTLATTVSADFVGQCQTRQTLNASLALTVNVTPGSPTVTGNLRFGPGSLTLTAGGVFPVPANFKWYSPAGTFLFQGNPYNTPSVAASATPYVKVTSLGSNNCESAPTTVNVTIQPLPVLGYTTSINYIPIGGTTTLTTVADYDSYVWKQNATTLATTKTLVVNTPGTYTATVTLSGASVTASIDVGDNLANQNLNIIVENDLLVSGILSQSQISSLLIGSRNQKVQYFDGLGRPSMTVVTQGTPLKNDIVIPNVYDAMGREYRKYLPVSDDNTGRAKLGILDASNNYSGAVLTYYNTSTDKIADDSSPYSQTVFEASPLSRVIKQGAPGVTWQPDATNSYLSTDRTVKKSYGSNVVTEVLLWTYTAPNATYPLGLVNTGSGSTPAYYAANQLVKNKTKDEQGNEVIEFVDILGRTVLKQVQAGATTYANTYYIYDDLGSLVCVIPPEAVARLATDYYQAGATDATKDSFLGRWAFRYAYDGKKRMIQKQVPGAEMVSMVYDNRDRVVMTQDGNQRWNKKWSYTIYDALNRPVMTGIYTHGSIITQSVMQGLLSPVNLFETFTGATTNHGYTNTVFSNATNFVQSGFDVNTVTYYDDYAFKNLWANTIYDYVPNEITPQTSLTGTYSQEPTFFIRTKGQVTGAKVKILGSNTFLNKINYYDSKYRVIQTIADNQLSSFDRQTTLYDFQGKPLATKNTTGYAPISWKDVGGLTTTRNSLTMTNVTGWGNAGAASVQQLAASTDGWMEVTVSENISYRTLGWSATNADASYASIGYGIYLNMGIFSVLESGTIKFNGPAIFPGDVLRIERVGTTIRYLRNGALVYTSLVPSSSSLLIDVAMYSQWSTIQNIRTSFAAQFNTISRRFEYDHAGRLLKTWHAVNTLPEVLLNQSEYNELGQLVAKKLHAQADGTIGQEGVIYNNTNLVVSQYQGEKAFIARNSITLSPGFYAQAGSTLNVRTENQWNAGNSNPANGSFAQVVDYRYNIRGWMTKMNESDVSNVPAGDPRDYFGMELLYEQADAGIANTQAYNGNISAMKWSKNQSLGLTKENAYAYSYDPMNRITGAAFKERTGLWAAATNNGFSESGYAYDLNGNITSLLRYDKRGSGTASDILSYDYGTGPSASNKLLGVADAGDKTTGFIDGSNSGSDYTYDSNGSMITDQNKGITTPIAYNFLNLPELISRGGNTAQYIYDATGRKLSQVVTFSGTQKWTDYAGELVYENNIPQFINHEEGRIMLSEIKTVYTNSCDVSTDMTASNATLATITQNGTEKYVKATSNGTTALTGIWPIGGGFPVQPGETYKIRARGYRDKGTAASSSNVYLYIKADATPLGWPGASLPASSATAPTESWIEQTVTIPTGTSILQAGVVWNTVQTGEVFFLNDFEITKVSISKSLDYQYHLKDHLGNVRTTFTMRANIDVSKATVETANLNTETNQFLNMTRARRVNARIYDHTYDGQTAPVAGAFAVRLTGSANEKIGLVKSISVMPGDKIDVEVFGKYFDPTASNDAALVSALGAIAAGTAGVGTVIDGAGYSTAGAATYPFTGFLGHSENGTGPKAYLNYLIFDRNFVYQTGGFKRLSSNAKETGDLVNHTGLNYEGVAHERLAFDGADQIQITQPGYVYIWLSNEELNPVEVYFDDLKVTHTKSQVIQQEDYYPFGLVFNRFQRENILYDKVQYNEMESQDDLQLGWLDYGARFLMPEIGRWAQLDPLSDLSLRFGGYVYGRDNPIRFTDPSGMQDQDEVKRNTYSKDGQYHVDIYYESNTIGSSGTFSDGSLTNYQMKHFTIKQDVTKSNTSLMLAKAEMQRSQMIKKDLLLSLYQLVKKGKVIEMLEMSYAATSPVFKRSHPNLGRAVKGLGWFDSVISLSIAIESQDELEVLKSTIGLGVKILKVADGYAEIELGYDLIKLIGASSLPEYSKALRQNSNSYYMNSFYYGANRDAASKWLDKSIEMEKQADKYETAHREWNDN